MRYITACSDIEIRDLEDKVAALVPWSNPCKTLFRDPRLLQALDVFSLMDLRKKIIGAKAGEVIEISDEDWAALSPSLKHPSIFSNDFVYSGEAFFRAFLDAPSKDPR